MQLGLRRGRCPTKRLHRDQRREAHRALQSRSHPPVGGRGSERRWPVRRNGQERRSWLPQSWARTQTLFRRPGSRVRRRRSEEHTSELQSLMRISYAVFCLKKKKQNESNN